MASVNLYTWKKTDQRWSVAARFLEDAGYSTVSDFMTQIVADNAILDWTAVPEGTIIRLSYQTS